MPEWFKGPVLKTGVRKRTVGSNPSPSGLVIWEVCIVCLPFSFSTACATPLLLLYRFNLAAYESRERNAVEQPNQPAKGSDCFALLRSRL